MAQSWLMDVDVTTGGVLTHYHRDATTNTASANIVSSRSKAYPIRQKLSKKPTSVFTS